MEKDITRFRGCLKGIYKFEINQQLIDIMLEKDIIYLHGPDDYPETGEPTEINFEIIFNGNIYYANEDIIQDVYQQTIDQFFELQFGENFLLEDIKKEIFSNSDIEDQINYLKEHRKHLIDNLSSLEYYLSYEEFANKVYNNGIDDWGVIKSYGFGESYADMIRHSTKSGGYFFYYDFNFTFTKPLINDFGNFRKTKCKLDFINQKLFELENDQPVKNDKGFANATQKMMLLTKIINYKDWNHLSTNMKAKILEPILGHHKDTIINSIDVLDPNKSFVTKKNINKDKKVVEEYLKKLGISLGDLSD